MSEPSTDFLSHCATLHEYVPLNLSEADTRAHLVDPVLRILGYVGVADVRREVTVPATKESLDYELYADGKAQVIVEAKALRHSVTDQAAAQCVQYAAVLGVPWCIITNGVMWAIYNAHARGPLADKKVALVRLDGDEQAIGEAWDVLSLFGKRSLEQAHPLTALLTDRVVIDELSRSDSSAISALRKAVNDRFGERVAGPVVVEAIQRWRVRESPEPPTVKLSDATTPHRRASSGPRAKNRPDFSNAAVRVSELVEAGLLPPDAAIEARTRRGSYVARVKGSGIEYAGTLYPTLSAAAGAAQGGSINGWEFWTFRGAKLSELRRRLASSSQSSTSG